MKVAEERSLQQHNIPHAMFVLMGVAISELIRSSSFFSPFGVYLIDSDCKTNQLFVNWCDSRRDKGHFNSSSAT